MWPGTNQKNMRILISKEPKFTDKLDYRKLIQAVAGQWLEVETKYLFNNQYNTKPTADQLKIDPKCSGLRIHDVDVEKIENDARIGKAKCNYCGKIIQADEKCYSYQECEQYGANKFTKENTYFIKYPNGYLSRTIESKWIGSYFLEILASKNMYRLTNKVKVIDFKYAENIFWVSNGIGFNPVKKLNIGSIPQKLLTQYLQTI